MTNAIIIVGFYDWDQLEQFYNTTHQIFLIEPRKAILDSIRFNLPQGVYLMPKMICKNSTLTEETLYECISLDTTPHPIYTITTSSQKEIMYKERVYTTNFQDLIKTHRINRIKRIVWNMNDENWAGCLDSIIHYHNIIERIEFNNDTTEFNPEDSTCIKNHFNHPPDSQVFTNTKLLNGITCPEILTFLTQPVRETATVDYNLLKNHYNIMQIESPETTIANKTLFDSKKTYIYDKISALLERLFSPSQHDTIATQDTHDQLVMIFNPAILSKKFQIHYPINDETIYINQDLDVLYSSRNTMFLLYETIKSPSFVEYVETIKREKKEVMFRIFQKRHFYDYLRRIFNVISF